MNDYALIVTSFGKVSYSIDVNEIFSGNYKMNRNADTSYIDNTIYVFRGLICYYGHHYVSIFQEYSPGEPVFLLFDDQVSFLSTLRSPIYYC